MNVHSLWIYPVKSLAGIAVDGFALDDFGPVGDRRWMIVDDEGRFVTQRNRPELALVRTSIGARGAEIVIPDEGRFRLVPTGQSLKALVWRDWVGALVGEAPANEALSRYCNAPLRLVFMPDDSFRRVDAGRVQDVRRVSFADGFPLLIANLASLQELNGRLASPVEMRRFRPNLVVEGAQPWAEDQWRELTIGETRFSLVKPCSRCVMTTVDPDTGVKDASVQPLRTLSGYRRTNDGVIFGMNAIHESSGRIQKNAPVVINRME